MYIPAVYVLLGFCSVLVLPSPNSQFHDTIPSYDVDVSVNTTVNGSSPLVGKPVKSASGSVSSIVAVVVFVSVAPSLSVTFNETV